MANYICLTTIPPRFNNLHKFIKYIKITFNNQFDKIKIYVPKNYIRFPRKYDFPTNIMNDKLVDVIICEKDWGPGTKFIGPVLYDPNINDDDNIYIIDDDTLKHFKWLFISKNYLNMYPKSVIQLRVSSYINKPLKLNILQIHGVSGFCFKKGVLNNTNFYNFIKNLPTYIYFIDDDYLTYYLYLSKIKIIMTHPIVARKYLSQSGGLINQNGILKRSKLRKIAQQYFTHKYNMKFSFFHLL